MPSHRLPAPTATLIERIVPHERTVLVATLALVTLACWAWIVPMARDMYGAMTGPSAWMMTHTWDTTRLLWLGAMWIVMMTGMMLPSAAPTLLLYATAARRRAGGRQSAWPVYAMAAGYLLVWAAFGLSAMLLQRMLSGLLVLSPMMEVTSPWLSGALLIGAGAYQFTPLKRACLAWCGSPLMFLMRRWRDHSAGAFSLGVEHGLFCLGCCWALMLLLFVGGVMNLAVIGVLVALVLVEKLVPFGAQSLRVTGVLLIVVGVWVLVD